MLLYADDIVLLAPSVSALEKLLSVCETKLRWMDMVNTKKSSCLRVGFRYKINCNNIINIDKAKLEWRDEIRYLAVYITSSSAYSWSFKHSKQAVYRSFNAIFKKLGRIAIEKVVLKLLKKYFHPKQTRFYSSGPESVCKISSKSNQNCNHKSVYGRTDRQNDRMTEVIL